jgi:plastocyanin
VSAFSSDSQKSFKVRATMKLRLFALKAIAVSGAILLAASASLAGEIKGKVSVQGIKSAENIAVYVEAIPEKKFDAPTTKPLIDQMKMTFVPHVTVVQVGTTVEFLNSDPVGHNVYWPSISGNKKLAHNLGTWPKGDKKSFQFNDVGVAGLLCNVHPEMNGYVVVSPTPYFALTDKSGNYEIKNVPPGKYTLKTWSEDGKVTTQAVEVAAGAVTADLTVKK